MVRASTRGQKTATQHDDLFLHPAEIVFLSSLRSRRVEGRKDGCAALTSPLRRSLKDRKTDHRFQSGVAAMRYGLVAGLAALSMAAAGAAHAGEFGVGVAAHDVDLWKEQCCFESGQNIELHGRTDPIEGMKRFGSFRLWASASANTDGGTNYVAAGLMRRFWDNDETPFYAQLSVGLGVHDGPSEDYQKTPDRIYFGSRVLIASEAAAGWRMSDDWSAEAAYFHLSHGGLAGDQNPGLDVISVRLIRKF
jgi:hypothetical protein